MCWWSLRRSCYRFVKSYVKPDPISLPTVQTVSQLHSHKQRTNSKSQIIRCFNDICYSFIKVLVYNAYFCISYLCQIKIKIFNTYMSQLMHELGSKSIYTSDNSVEGDIFTYHLQVVYNDYVFQLCNAVLSSSELNFLPFSDNFAPFKCFVCWLIRFGVAFFVCFICSYQYLTTPTIK